MYQNLRALSCIKYWLNIYLARARARTHAHPKHTIVRGTVDEARQLHRHVELVSATSTPDSNTQSKSNCILQTLEAQHVSCILL